MIAKLFERFTENDEESAGDEARERQSPDWRRSARQSGDWRSRVSTRAIPAKRVLLALSGSGRIAT
jgi:hypothetical protein